MEMRYRSICLLILGIGLILASAAAAEAPRLVNYQGILTDQDGELLNGTYLLTFYIYPDSAQGSPFLWMERHENVDVTNGLFNLILGSNTSFPESLFADDERWLGIAVNTDPEIYPRMRITSTPYALRAAIADSAMGAASGADADWVITGNDMFSGVSGNVGIGTNTPGKRLQVGDNTVPDSEGMIRLASRSGTQGSNRIWDIGVPETDADTSGPGYSFVIDDTQNGSDPEFMVKYGTGHVGIGRTAPDAPLHVYKPLDSTAEAALHVETLYDAGPLNLYASLLFEKTRIEGQGSLGDAPVSINYNSIGNVYLAFGGGDVGIGTTTPTARLDVAGDARVEVIHISGADVAENFPVSEHIEPGMVVAIDPDQPGQLCLSRGSYNRRVAGVVSGANDLPTGAILGNLPGQEEALPVALSGRVWVHCDATEGPIQPGDMLTTAAAPGYAMKVEDFSKAQGAIIGKAMTPLVSGRGLVLVLVSLQ